MTKPRTMIETGYVARTRKEISVNLVLGISKIRDNMEYVCVDRKIILT